MCLLAAKMWESWCVMQGRIQREVSGHKYTHTFLLSAVFLASKLHTPRLAWHLCWLWAWPVEQAKLGVQDKVFLFMTKIRNWFLLVYLLKLHKTIFLSCAYLRAYLILFNQPKSQNGAATELEQPIIPNWQMADLHQGIAMQSGLKLPPFTGKDTWEVRAKCKTHSYTATSMRKFDSPAPVEPLHQFHPRRREKDIL